MPGIDFRMLEMNGQVDAITKRLRDSDRKAINDTLRSGLLRNDPDAANDQRWRVRENLLKSMAIEAPLSDIKDLLYEPSNSSRQRKMVSGINEKNADLMDLILNTGENAYAEAVDRYVEKAAKNGWSISQADTQATRHERERIISNGPGYIADHIRDKPCHTAINDEQAIKDAVMAEATGIDWDRFDADVSGEDTWQMMERRAKGNPKDRDIQGWLHDDPVWATTKYEHELRMDPLEARPYLEGTTRDVSLAISHDWDQDSRDMSFRTKMLGSTLDAAYAGDLKPLAQTLKNHYGHTEYDREVFTIDDYQTSKVLGLTSHDIEHLLGPQQDDATDIYALETKGREQDDDEMSF